MGMATMANIKTLFVTLKAMPNNVKHTKAIFHQLF